MLMLMCITEPETNTHTGAINSTGLHSPYIAGPSPLVSGCQARGKDSHLWECCADLAKSTAKWSSLFSTCMADGGIHLLRDEGLSQKTKLLNHQLQESHLRTPKDWVNITSRQQQSLQ